MLPEAPAQPQPIMRDFLGLGKLAVEDHAEGDGASQQPPFYSPLCFPTSSVNMDSAGSKYPLFNLVASIDNDFTLHKPSDGYHEGSAETFGLPYPKPWQGIGPNPARMETNVKKSPLQLTIFYGGHVNVYNNIPVERAEAIMKLAAEVDCPSSAPFGVPRPFATPSFFQPSTLAENIRFNTQLGAPVHFASDEASQNGLPVQGQFDGGAPNTPSTAATSCQPAVPKALPLARKASLARFLEKRKERMQMMSPYFKKQLVPEQREEIGSSLPHAAFGELYGQYIRRSTLGFSSQEKTDRSVFDIPAKHR